MHRRGNLAWKIEDMPGMSSKRYDDEVEERRRRRFFHKLTRGAGKRKARRAAVKATRQKDGYDEDSVVRGEEGLPSITGIWA